MARRGYPPEFRQRVIELVEGGRRVAEVAADLGISQQTIYTWRRQARIDAGLLGFRGVERRGTSHPEPGDLHAARDFK
jgi:transposase-like protein